jgi:hypothetical protein
VAASKLSQVIFGVWVFVFYFVIELLVIVYCYLQIVFAIRTRVEVFTEQQANNPVAVTANTQSVTAQMNAVKTMLAVSVAFVVFWMPSCILQMWSLFNENMMFALYIYYMTMLLSSINMAVNPIIYATSYEPVKEFCRRLISYRAVRNARHASTINVITVQSAEQLQLADSDM